MLLQSATRHRKSRQSHLRYDPITHSMEGKRRSTASSKYMRRRAGYRMLELPMDLWDQLLGRLKPGDHLRLLQTSKVMAQHVMQHNKGRLTFQVDLSQRWMWPVSAEAIKKVLQWAPPACLKLKIIGKRGNRWEDPFAGLSRLFSPPPSTAPGPVRPKHDHMQQFPCILEVCIEGMQDMPGLVPAGLAASCPNMAILRLIKCDFMASGSGSNEQLQVQSSCCSSNAGSSSTNHSRQGDASGDVRPAQQLHTLVLYCDDIPQLTAKQPGKADQTRSTAKYRQQLRRSMPSVRRLELYVTAANQTSSVGILKALGPQLKELHLPQLESGQFQHIQAAGSWLRTLQKLVAQDNNIKSAEDMEFLLSLRNLEHLELGSVGTLSGDYSSRACKWQNLHLRPPVSVEALAKLPLHSLQQPLVLGTGHRAHDCNLQVHLPSSSEPQTLASLRHLSEQLKKAGVLNLAPDLHWVSPHLRVQQGPALTIISPAFGDWKSSITLKEMTVGEEVLQALASVYKQRLETLSISGCGFEQHMRHAWHIALSGMPSLMEVKLVDWYKNCQQRQLAKVIHDLAVAMARQPAGHFIVVKVGRDGSNSSETLAQVMDGIKEEVAGVEVRPACWDPSDDRSLAGWGLVALIRRKDS